jgi:hypothetical protein
MMMSLTWRWSKTFSPGRFNRRYTRVKRSCYGASPPPVPCLGGEGWSLADEKLEAEAEEISISLNREPLYRIVGLQVGSGEDQHQIPNG